MERIIVWLFLFFSFPPLIVSGRRITCMSSESVQEEESAVITCHYHINLKGHRRGFYIYKYPFGSKDPDVPAICDWDEDFIRCDVRAGYNIKVHGHKMILNISSAQQSHAGRYICHVLQPEDDIQSQECDLVVQNKENGSKVDCYAISYSDREHPTTILCFVPESLKATSIVLEKQEPSDPSAAAEIIRCNSKDDMCRTSDIRYQFSIRRSSSTNLRMLIAVVDKAGHYTCKAERKHMQTQSCDLQVHEGPKLVTIKVASPQQLGPLQIVPVVVSVVLLVAAIFISIFCARKRCLITPGHSANPDTGD